MSVNIGRSGNGVRTRRILVWGLILLLSGWYGVQLKQAATAGRLPLYDFIEYWAAGRLLIQGENPYSPQGMLAIQRIIGWTDARPIMMWNPPWSLLFVLPFAVLPYWPGRALWFLFHLSITIASAGWLWRYYGGPDNRKWIAWLAAIVFLPVPTAMYLGQISPLILAGIALFLWAVDRQKAVIAGISVLLIAVKPHLAYLFWLILLFWTLRTRQWKLLLCAAISVILPLLVVLLINPSVLGQYVGGLRSEVSPVIWQTPTWGVALLMLFPGAGDWLRFSPTILGLALAVVLWVRWKSAFSWKAHMIPILLLSVITSSFTWMFDWVVLLPVLTLILVWFQARPTRKWWLPVSFLVMQFILVLQPSVARSNFYTIWIPPALAALFLAGRRAAKVEVL